MTPLLIRGDCMAEMAKLPSASVDLVLCDLPYGTTKNKWDSVLPLDALWREYKRLCKGAVVLTASQPFTSALVMSNLSGFRHDWVWSKSAATGHLNAKRKPMRAHEDVLVFSVAPPPYFPQGLVPYGRTVRRGHNGSNFGRSGTENTQASTGFPRSILHVPGDTKRTHPTQKPIALMEYMIRTYSREGDTVLDNTMGSGTTGVACVNAGRRFIGIEKDADYFRIAQQRIEAALVARRQTLQDIL